MVNKKFIKKDSDIKMFKIRFRIFIFFFFCISTLKMLSAQVSNNTISQLNYSPLSTAVPFMILAADPKNGGYGNVGLGMPANVNSTFWNIAKMSHIQDKYVASLNYTPLLVNLQIDNYALFSFTNTYRFDNHNTISLFGRYLNIKSFDITNQQGDLIGRTTPVQGSLGAGFSVRLSRYLSLGASGKFIYSNLAPNYKSSDGSTSLLVPANVLALDFGLDYEREIKEDLILTVGMAVSNLGNKVNYTNDGRFSFIPANLSIGGGIKKILSNQHTIICGLDISKLLVPVRPLDTGGVIKQYYDQSIFSSWFNSFSDAQGGFLEELKEIVTNVGFEYVYRNAFHGKIGYIYQNALKGNSSMVTLGLGITHKRFDIDIAYGIPTYSNANYNTSPLANSFRFGLSYRVGEE